MRYVTFLVLISTIIAFVYGDDDQERHLHPGHRPNILFIMTDQMRFDAIRRVQDELRRYDDSTKINTPALDRLISEGAYFRNAYCQCAVCAPSRTSLRTGCTIERTGVQHNDMVNKDMKVPIFTDRVKALEGLDQVLVDKLGYVSEYYGKTHMPKSLMLHTKSYPEAEEHVVQFNDFDYTDGTFGYNDDRHNHKTRRYLSHFLNRGDILPRQKSVDLTSNATRQIDSYTKYPYEPIQLDSRYNSKSGMELTAENGFASYERGESNLKGVYSLSEKYTPTHFTGDIGRRALERLMDQPKPWFLTLSFKNPHPPFVTPWFPYMEWYWQNRDTLFVPPSINDEHMENSAYRSMKEKLPGYGDPIKVKEWMAIYYAMIEEIDYEIDGILSTLGDAQNNTLIIFTSDHGEMLGAHGKRSKNNFYEESTRVPLVMKYSGYIDPSTEINEMVSHLDVFSTILDYASASDIDKSDGRSLRPFIEGREYNIDFDEDVVFSEWDFRIPLIENQSKLDRKIDDRPCLLVRKGNYKLMMQKIASTNNLDMMFDLEQDPYEMNNLLGRNGMSANDVHIQKAEHMRCLLLDWMQRMDGPIGYFSDPAANFGEGAGDVMEIRNRQKWRETGFWTSENSLAFGRIAIDDQGNYVRREYLYLGTRKDETIDVSSITIVGADAAYFSVNRNRLELHQNDCQNIMVKFSATQENWKGKTSVDASLVIIREVVSGAFGSPKMYFQVQLLLSDYNFQNAGTEKGQEHELGNEGNIETEQESDETGGTIIDVVIGKPQETNEWSHIEEVGNEGNIETEQELDETGGTIIDVAIGRTQEPNVWSHIEEEEEEEEEGEEENEGDIETEQESNETDIAIGKITQEKNIWSHIKAFFGFEEDERGETTSKSNRKKPADGELDNVKSSHGASYRNGKRYWISFYCTFCFFNLSMLLNLL